MTDWRKKVLDEANTIVNTVQAEYEKDKTNDLKAAEYLGAMRVGNKVLDVVRRWLESEAAELEKPVKKNKDN